MPPYYLWINRQQPPLRIDQGDISLSLREYIVFKIRQTLGPESDEEDDFYNDDVMESQERLPPVRLDFRFSNDTVRLSCDPKYLVWWQDIDSNAPERGLWLEENGLQLMWNKDYQIDVLDSGNYVSMFLMVTQNTDYPIRTPSPPSVPSTPVGRDTPSPHRAPKKPVPQLLHLLQSYLLFQTQSARHKTRE